MAGRLDAAYVSRLPAKLAAAREFERHVQNVQLAGIGKLALKHPGLFGAHYLNLEMQSFHVDMSAKMRDKDIKRGLILAPADHGKSTICSNLVPVMEIAEDRNIRIAIISAAAALSETLGRGILGHLTTNQRLISDFGGFYSPNVKWTTSEAIVAGRDNTRTLRDATLLLGGAGATWFGRRADLIICDDMITLDNAATPELRNKMRQWFMEAVVNMLEPDGRLWVIGTVQHHADLYAELKGKPEYTVVHYDAVQDEASEKTLWVSKWPWEKLMQRKGEIGSIAFDKRYRNISRDETQLVFAEKWLDGSDGHPAKCYDPDHVIGEPEPDWVLAQFVDPAIGKSAASKYFAKLVIGWDRTLRQMHIVDALRTRLSQPEQEKLIVADHHNYGLVATVIEANAYQAGLAQGVQQRALEQGFPITVLQHQTGKNKIDPMVGILQLLPPLVENGMVKLPRGNPRSVRLTSLITDELLPYPQGLTTDLVMCLWFAALYFAAPKAEAKVSQGNTIRGTHLMRRGRLWSRSQ